MGFNVGASVGPVYAGISMRLVKRTGAVAVNPVFHVILALACGVVGVLTGHGFAEGMFVGIAWFWIGLIVLMLLAWVLVIAVVVLSPVLFVVWLAVMVVWSLGTGIVEGIRE